MWKYEYEGEELTIIIRKQKDSTSCLIGLDLLDSEYLIIHAISQLEIATNPFVFEQAASTTAASFEPKISAYPLGFWEMGIFYSKIAMDQIHLVQFLTLLSLSHQMSWLWLP